MKQAFLKFAIMCILCIVMSMVSSDILVEAATIDKSGTCGDLYWTIDSNGLLYISGSGDYVYLDEIDNYIMPVWSEYRDDIKSVKVDVSNITNCQAMFRGLENVKTIDLKEMNTLYVTDMSYMFYGCESLTSITFGDFNTSNVIDMSDMFSECKSLETVSLDKFNTLRVTDMSYMFSGCEQLELIDVSGFNTSNVIDMSDMFSECKSLETVSLDKFNTSRVICMGGMFSGCENLTSIDVSGFNTSRVTYMTYMFSGCENLTSIDVSGFNTSRVTDMSYMFSGCENLTSIDVSNFDTSKVTEMIGMFHMCKRIDELDLSGFDLSNLQNVLSGSDYFIHEHEGMRLKTPLNYKADTSFQHNLHDLASNLLCWQDESGNVYEYFPRLSYSVTLTLKKWDITEQNTTEQTVNESDSNESPTVGTQKTISSAVYKITKSTASQKEVTFVKPTSSKKTSITIPSTVTIDGYTYKVTEIAPKAFKNNKKLKSVTIGKNVKKIGKETFYNCKNLKKITIKSSVLKSVGKNAIKNINKKATIKVPKKQLKAYKKLFKSKTGYKKTMKIKK